MTHRKCYLLSALDLHAGPLQKTPVAPRPRGTQRDLISTNKDENFIWACMDIT